MDALKTVFSKLLPLSGKNELHVRYCSVRGCSYVIWKITDFSERSFHTGGLTSPSFSCCDAEWTLGLEATSQATHDKAETLNLCIVKTSPYTGVHNISFKIGLKNKFGKFETIFQYGTECDGKDGVWYPLISFCQEELLEVYAPENTLTVLFELKILYSFGKVPKILLGKNKDHLMTAYERMTAYESCNYLIGRNTTERAGAETLSSNFEKLLYYDENCDVTLQVGDKNFLAHKLILGARSPVFSAMFEHDMQENRNNSVTISDIQPLIFKDVLRYIYTGRIPNLSLNKAIGLYKPGGQIRFERIKNAVCGNHDGQFKFQ